MIEEGFVEEESKAVIWGRCSRGRVLRESSPGRMNTWQDDHVAGVQ